MARALLLWPGGLFGAGANFGVPQILAIAAAMKARTGIDVDVVDLDAERGLGEVDLRRILTAHAYGIVGIACYSSYDYLKVMAIGEAAREALPRAWITTGGYHPSARPDDFTGEGSPFDFVVVGDGEGPMARLAEARLSGKRPLMRVLGPEPVSHPGQMPPVDWELLARYRPIARRVASQAEIYLSRGCPYDCAFCMERAKRDTSWRALEPEAAVDEVHRLDRFLDLSGFTLFIADALFGMKTPWRRAFLEGLARRPSRARKIWLLVRLDLLEREDVALMARANVAPGFGLESGDPDQVRRIRKVGRLSDYLDQMVRVAGWARELGVPWGANVIVGHPGETEASIRTSARYLTELFHHGTTGFLSVDPFRLYPGSPIDEERPRWEAETGMRVRRYPWWHDGDQDFLSEWVDPSSELDFRRCFELRRELFEPIVRSVGARFSYDGPAPEYFRRAIDEQIALFDPRMLARTLALEHMWRRLADDQVTDVASDALFASLSRDARAKVDLGVDDPMARAVVATPRERFVPVEELPDAHRDRAIPLDAEWRASVSAMHAYVAQMRAIGLRDGDEVVDLGGGTGYGAAVAAAIVGPKGRVTTIEIDPTLAARATELLGDRARVLAADAHDTSLWRGARRVMTGFDVGAIPAAWIDALAPGGRLVAPESGELVLVEKAEDGAVTRRSLGAVVFVADRGQIQGGEPAGVIGSEPRGARTIAE